MRLIICLFLFIATTSSQQINFNNLVINIAGNGNPGYWGDGNFANSSILRLPDDIIIDSSNNLYISDSGNNIIRMISSSSNIITTYAGTSPNEIPQCVTDCLATSAMLHTPMHMAFDNENEDLFFADLGNRVVRRVHRTSGNITVYAGKMNIYWGMPGDGGLATNAVIYSPYGLAFDSYDNLFISDSSSNYIRRVDAKTGIISTYAGFPDGFHYSWSNASGVAVMGLIPDVVIMLSHPAGLFIDESDNLFIADTYNNVIRKVPLSTGISSEVVAGMSHAWSGYAGDGGLATAAMLNLPNDVTVDSNGTLYIADAGNNVVRVVWSLSNETIIDTFAGSGMKGYNGDKLSSLDTDFSDCHAVLVRDSYLYISDTENNIIRKLSLL